MKTNSNWPCFTRLSVTLLTGLAGLMALSPAHSQEQSGATWAGAAWAGREIARVWCAHCHAVDAAPQSETDAAPSFATIAARPLTTAQSVRLFLQQPHGDMPDFRLAAPEIDDLAAYILDLRKKQ